jgi:hypothetical protein
MVPPRRRFARRAVSRTQTHRLIDNLQLAANGSR